MTGASGRTIAVGRAGKSPPGRVRRASPPRAGLGIARPALEPHQVDILGLALVALGVFLGGVGYLEWPGGALGRGAMSAARLALGSVGYAVPAVLAVGGVMLVFRELCPANRPIRAGGTCLVSALTLAMASGTLGLRPGETAGRHYWQPSALRLRGGMIGQAELWAASHLVSHIGADILAVFLFVSGLMLVSRATAAGVIRAAAAVLQGFGRAVKRSTDALFTMVRRSARIATGLESDSTELVVTAIQATGGRAVHRQPSDVGERTAVSARGDHEPAAPDDVIGSASGEVGSGDLTGPSRCSAAVGRGGWRVPSSRILTRSSAETAQPDSAGQEETARTLLETLGHFGIEAKLVGRETGPHITRYELRLAPGTKVAKVAQLGDDLAYALAATDIRIQAPIPGKQAVGVEVPNARRRIVHLGDVFQAPPSDWSPLSVWLGTDISGRAIGADLARMPHLLVAGTTGAGKSACLNVMLCSILLRAAPDEVRLVLVDPKQVELNHYESIPHLLTPVITSPRTAADALQNLLLEMEQRYDVMSLARTRSLPELNRARERHSERPLPFILCVIDEFADLMMVSPAEVEDAIIRLAQKARAVGIHLLLATQSPRADVITGLIKANVPSRIAFAVSSQTDSRVILDQGGAESLLGQGDMLFSPLGAKVQRLQGAFIDERQIAAVTDAWRQQGEPDLHEHLLENAGSDQVDDREDSEPAADEDPLLADAIALVAQVGTASTSLLQRRLRIGYTRAGRLIDMLERRGVISGYEGCKPRQVLIGDADVPRILSQPAHRHTATGEAGPRR
jgi:S-DNA-T family DNA segregation ATPase FtsK/SpoIIIE